MKIAFVQATPFIPGSIDLPGYADLMADAGHEVVFVSPDRNTLGTRHAVVVAPLDDLADPAFWAHLGAGAAVTLLWFNAPAVVEAMRAADVRVFSIGDTDGEASVRVFPRAFFTNMVRPATGVIARVRLAWSFLHRYAIRYRAEDGAVRRTLAGSDVLSVESPTALSKMTAVARAIGCDDLVSRLRVVPHAVEAQFTTGDVLAASRREHRIVSTGRLTATQKNAPMLAGAVRRIASHVPGVSVTLAGADCSGPFARFAGVGNVECLGLVSRGTVRGVLASSKIFISAAWWETQPIAALEALCCGCSVVGMPIPGYVDLCSAGPFGRVASGFSARRLARAAREELDAWAAGQRDPVAIAEYWRARVAEPVVVAQILSALHAAPPGSYV